MKYIYQGITLIITIYFIVIIHINQLELVGIIREGYNVRTIGDALVGAGLISIIPLAVGILICAAIHNEYQSERFK